MSSAAETRLVRAGTLLLALAAAIAPAASESDRELGVQATELRGRVKELETGLERISEIVMVEPRE